jgi:hypothetical protein
MKNARQMSRESFGAVRPLTAVPALIPYAEKETAVLAERSPTRAALERATAAWFPQGECRLVASRGGPPRPARLPHISLRRFRAADWRILPPVKIG